MSVALEKIKADNDIGDAVQSVREGLDEAADELLEKFLNPEMWVDEPGSVEES